MSPVKHIRIRSHLDTQDKPATTFQLISNKLSDCTAEVQILQANSTSLFFIAVRVKLLSHRGTFVLAG